MLIDKSTNNETISQIKLTHHNRMMGKIADGMPICTSVEIARGYDPRVRTMLWFKTVEHTYYSLDGNHQHTTNIIRTAVDNSDELLGKLTKINFKDLKNNYFTDAAPHKYSWWELNYNHRFYVVGTYDNLIPFRKLRVKSGNRSNPLAVWLICLTATRLSQPLVEVESEPQVISARTHP